MKLKNCAFADGRKEILCIFLKCRSLLALRFIFALNLFISTFVVHKVSSAPDAHFHYFPQAVCETITYKKSEM